MANKIYDFLPRHLKNRELESMFEATFERVFSKGDMEKTRAFVGRKERGIYDPSAKCFIPYLTYPGNSRDRKNYGFEPVYANDVQGEYAFYDDFINSLYNKGAYTNDHYRLLDHVLETVNIPIDKDKFNNYELYYWLTPDFDHVDLPITINKSEFKNYVTIDKPGSSWWSQHNSWYHYDDIKDYIDDTNVEFAIQGRRPIIELDSQIELSDTSAAFTDYNIVPDDFPTFKMYSWDNDILAYEYERDSYLFKYVLNDLSSIDEELEFRAKLVAGDFLSEFVFMIDMNETEFFNRDGNHTGAYIETFFDYRNIRQEFTEGEEREILFLTVEPKDDTVDIFIDGKKLLDSEYTISGTQITLNESTEQYMYVDFCAEDTFSVLDENAFQRLHPSFEYNPDGETFLSREFSYSVFYEHFFRIIETTPGLSGEAISFNTYRLIGDPEDKTRFNDSGSVMVRSTADTGLSVFAATRDDYNPYEAAKFLASAYSNYKHRLITNINKIIDEDQNADMLTDNQLLEMAIQNIAVLKKSTISMFSDQNMMKYGVDVAQYEELPVAVIDSVYEQFMPAFTNTIVNDSEVMIFLNGVIQRLGVDYTISGTGGEITFINHLPVTGDDIVIRHYYLTSETYIPPSATKLGIAPSYRPEFISDTEYDPDVTFLVGHDGSKLPVFGTRVDDILYEFETRIFNNLENHEDSYISSMEHSVFWNAYTDYSRNEKNFILYPLFKNWMITNNIFDLFNNDFDTTDWKTWNYSAYSDDIAGHWRGIYTYLYGTDMIFVEPWKILQLSQKPEDFDITYGTDYTTNVFWTTLIADSGLSVPSPIDVSDDIIPINDLVFSGTISNNDIGSLKAEWSFGDGSPVEQAWRRTSEFPFALFLEMLLQKPMQVISEYNEEIYQMVSVFNKRDSVDTDVVLEEKQNYEFRLGSKLAGFVNNFNLQAEDTSLRASEYYQIPEDNYDLFVHTSEPNRSEFFSGIILEKVSLDNPHPEYSLANVNSYMKGDIVLNTSDGKYYRRKIDGTTATENALTINFDYSAWVLISQPHTKTYGYRIQGYDTLNPAFYAMEWDRTSGEKVWSAEGDFIRIEQWISSTYYKKDTYIQYNNRPYVCLANHTSTTDFDIDLKYWKQLVDWPRKKVLSAYGFQKTKIDTVRRFGYGEILSSLDDIAHLFVGYQEYLKLVGWDFDTLDFNGNTIDFETKLIEFLEWAIQTHDVGEYIILTPMLTSGRFNAPYGTASIKQETSKNFYRVVDVAGRLIPENLIDFYIDHGEISFVSQVPIHGMKVDITDVEHAFVVDRVDSYGDVIYDPLTHNRNLRILVDCNRTVGWDGTLSADGYLVYNNNLVPNFDTLVEDTRYYRDVMVDQNLSVINHLKGRQIGFEPRSYLDNFGIERESQLEFYRGFIVDKGSVDSADRILNCNSKITSIDQSQVWAFKVAEYGGCFMDRTETTTINVSDMKSDPYYIPFYGLNPSLQTTDKKPHGNFKTSGYVSPELIDYVIPDTSEIKNIDTSSLSEGDLSWAQFDTEKEWDVLRLSEIAEVDYVRESIDGQLVLGLTNIVDSSELIYVQITDSAVDPYIQGYYRLVLEDTKTIGGVTVYEYLVFQDDYDPLIVEIDSSTSNSIYTPIGTNQGVSAIGSVSNPDLNNGDTLVIDGEEYVFSENAGSLSGIHIYGSVVDPVVTLGHQIKIVGYDDDGNVINPTSSIITFSQPTLIGTEPFSALAGDIVNVNGETLVINNSSTVPIHIESGATENDILTTGNQIILDGNIVTVADVSVTGTGATYPLTVNKPLNVNGTIVTLTSGMTILQVIDEINANSIDVTASDTGGQLTLTTSSPKLTLQGSVLVDLGISTNSSYENTKINILKDDINLLAIIGLVATISNQNLVLDTTEPTLDVQGTALTELGIGAGLYEAVIPPTPESVAEQINALGISQIDAEENSGNLSITTTETFITIVEVTAGALSRLGYDASIIQVDGTNTYVQYTSMDQIAFHLTEATAGAGDVLTASVVNRKMELHSGIVGFLLNRLEISNVSGTALSDIGFQAGTYQNVASANRDVEKLRDSINAYETDITASVGSGGRIIINSPSQAMTFAGTADGILEKLGLYESYTGIKSSPDFKVMDWKSVRFIPGVSGTDFDEWYQTLGLNDVTYIWVDDWEETGYAILNRDEFGNLTFHSRQATRIDTDKIDRVVVRDGEEFIRYDLYDPLNLKMPADLINSIDYITWEDPSQNSWFDSKVGTIWWDTELARYYRYDDYGDALGNQDIDYMKSYWGKLVPGSKIVIKEWVSSFVKPTTDDYASYTVWDRVDNHQKTKYFFWRNATNIDIDGKIMNSTDITEYLQTNTIMSDRFIPVRTDGIILTNNRNVFKDRTIDVTIQYDANPNEALKSPLHNEWELLGEKSNKSAPEFLVDELQESLADTSIEKTFFFNTTAGNLSNVNYAVYNILFLDECDIANTVITVNNIIVPSIYIEFVGLQLKILDDFEILEGDTLRLYKVKEASKEWFSDLAEARRNFESIVNTKLDNKLIASVFPDYTDYIHVDGEVFSLVDWSLTDKWQDVDTAAYITNNPSFDMNTLYDEGFSSFKVIGTDNTSYYFEVEDALMMVKKTSMSLGVSFDETIIDENNEIYNTNALNLQIYIFIEMMRDYMDESYIKEVMFDMVKYMYTEKTYPDWVFKTSYQDFIMTNTTMRQYTVYQRDSYDDVIDYVMEAKPYHVKIRAVDERYSLLEETVNLDIDSQHEMDIILRYGIQSYGAPVTQDIFDNVENECYMFEDFFETNAPHKDNITVMVKKSTGEYITVSPTDYSIIDNHLCITAFYDLAVGDHIMVERTYSRYTRDIISGGDHEIHDPETFPPIADGDYDAGPLLPIDNDFTNLAGGFDTGLIPTQMNDFMVLREWEDACCTTGLCGYNDRGLVLEPAQAEEDEDCGLYDYGLVVDPAWPSLCGVDDLGLVTEPAIPVPSCDIIPDYVTFWVYDQHGRGYKLETTMAGTIASLNSSEVIVNQASNFKLANGNTNRMVAVYDGTNVEFITYKKKQNTTLTIDGRGQYTGMSFPFASGDTIYIIEDPISINNYNQPELE